MELYCVVLRFILNNNKKMFCLILQTFPKVLAYFITAQQSHTDEGFSGAKPLRSMKNKCPHKNL